MGDEEDEEPLEAEIPRVRMNRKNPTSSEKQEHEDSGHAVCLNHRILKRILAGFVFAFQHDSAKTKVFDETDKK